jgi:hypothetical protein
MELRAADDIAEVCSRFAADPEVYSLSFRCLSAIAAVPKGIVSIGPAAPAIIVAVRDHFRSIQFSVSSGEDVMRLLGSMGLVGQLARNDVAGFDAAGGVALLVEVACMTHAAAGKTKLVPASAMHVVGPLIGAAAGVMDRVSRSKQGLDALLSNSESLASLVRLAGTNLNVAEIRSHDLRKSFRRAASMARLAGRMSVTPASKVSGNIMSPSTPTPAISSATSPGGTAVARSDPNAHLGPIFRVLDRAVRTDAGRDAVLAVGATTVLPSILEQIQNGRAGPSAGKPMEALLMRILSRLLGSDIGMLVERMGGEGGPGETVPMSERVLCARLLAGLMSDSDNRDALLRNEGVLATQLGQLLRTSPLCDSDAAASILQALTAVAKSGPDAIVTLFDSDILEAAGAVLAARVDEGPIVADAAALLSALIDCGDMVTVQCKVEVDTGRSRLLPSGTCALPVLVMRALDMNCLHEGASLSCLQFAEACLLFDDDKGSAAACLSSSGDSLITRAVRTMSSLPDALPVQALATDILNYLAVSTAVLSDMVDAGLIPRLVANLSEGEGQKGVAAVMGSPGASSVNPKALFSPGAADEEDDAAAAAAVSGFDAKTLTALSAALVSSTLHLLTSVAVLPAALAVAKESGIIHAVLSGFSRHSTDASVFRNFRAVIPALNISEDEVRSALDAADAAAGSLQSMLSINDADALAPAADFAEAFNLPVVPPAPTVSQARLAEILLEGIALLEAVTVSPVFVAIVVACGGVPALFRIVAVVAAVRIGEAKKGGKQSGASARMIDQILARTASTAAHISRVEYEVAGSAMEQDANYEALDYKQFGLEEAVYEKSGLALACRAMMVAAKPSNKSFTTAAVALLSWLASGQNHAKVREHVEALIDAGGIEASVAFLRSQNGALDMYSAVSGALARIAVAPRGAAAVAQRGASRQIIRMLREVATLRTPQGDGVFLSFLRLLDTCARGGSEAAELLRKQGTVDALLECVDAGAESDFFASEEQAAVAAHSSMTNLAAGGSTPEAASHLRRDISAAVSSLLSKLVGPELVRETSATLAALGRAVTSQTGGAFGVRTAVKIAGYAHTKVMRPLVLLGMLASTADAGAAGLEVMEAGTLGIIAIAAGGLAVGRVYGSEGTAPAPNSAEEELLASVPAAMRSIRQVLEPMIAKTGRGGLTSGAPAGAKALVEAVPIAVRALEERPVAVGPALQCLAALCSSEYAAAAVPPACDGRGVAVVLEALRAAGEAWDDEQMRFAFRALAGVAALPDCRPLVIVSGAPGVVLSLLSDMATDSSPEANGAALQLLAECSAEAKVTKELLSMGVLDSLRGALQQHCVDAAAPNPCVLEAAASLLSRLSVAKVVDRNVGGAGQDCRALIKRIVKTLAGSPAYSDSPTCAEAVLDAIASACTAAGALSEESATAAASTVIEADGEAAIVRAMSSSSADDRVLAAGARALASIGAASSATKTLAEIDEYAGRIPEWLEAGWESSSPEVIDLVAGMGDQMRALGSNIVSVVAGPDLSTLPDLGDSYKEVLMTVWRAVHAVVRDDMSSSRPEAGKPLPPVGNVSGKDLHTTRADVLALGAQITGRLAQVGAAAVAEEGADGAHAIVGEDVVNVLATVLYAAAADMLELRLVEAGCRALDYALTLYGGEAVVHSSGSGVITSLVSCAEKLEAAMTAAKAAEAAGGLGGTVADDHTPLEELSRMLHLIEGSLRAIVQTATDVLAQPSSEVTAALLAPAVALDVLLSAVHCSAADAGSDEINGEDGRELQVVVVSIVSASVTSGGSARNVPFQMLATIAARIDAEVSGPGKAAAQGLAPADVVSRIHVDVRMMAALAATVRSKLATPRGAGTAMRNVALLKAAAAALDVAAPNGREWRKAGQSALEGAKPEKAAPSETDAVRARSGVDMDVDAAKAAWSHVASAAAACLSPMFDTLAAAACGADIGEATTDVVKPALAATLGFVLQAGAPASRAVSLSALRTLCRLSDIPEHDAPPSTAALAARVERIVKLGKVGTYRALFAGLVAGEDVEQYAEEAVALIAALLLIDGVGLPSLGLSASALLSLQVVVRNFPSNAVLAAAGGALLSTLQSVFTEQSGAAFEASSKRAVTAVGDLVKSSFNRHRTEENEMYYAKAEGEESTWDAPDVVKSAMDELLAMDRMSRCLEDDAVTAVAPSVVDGMAAALVAHSHDPGVIGILTAALAKMAANPENHAMLLSKGIIGKLATILQEEGHETDPRCAEAFVSLVLPLSFDPDAVRQYLGPVGAGALVLRIANRFPVHLTSAIGSPMAWVPDHVTDYEGGLSGMEEAMRKGADGTERAKKSPRIVQAAAQTIANLACDNAPSDGTGPSTVDLLVEAGAVDILTALMRDHTDNPRLLEDVICGLSNLAFVSDQIQLQIGRTCMDAVCATTTRFNSDAYVFEMTLRAIGNLTRVDENILRAVACGVVRGIVEGMAKHADLPIVLKLCADVIGNMVSIDPRRVEAGTAVRVLKETLAEARQGSGAMASASSDEDIVSRLASGGLDVKEAVCALVYRDGGAKALVTTMVNHPARADLAASCLRALNYCVSSPALAATIVPALDLPSKVVLIMNANDTSPDVIKRACRILGGMAGYEGKLAGMVVAARAAPALLSVLETHRSSRELCFLAASVLTLLKGPVLGPALASAVRELRAVDTIASIFRAAVEEDDAEVFSVQLELLLILCQDADLAVPLACKAGPGLLHLMGRLKKAPLGGDEDAVTFLSFTLSVLAAIVRKGGAPAGSALLDAGLLLEVTSLLEAILEAGATSAAAMLAKESRRAVLYCVRLLAEVVRPFPPAGGEEAAAGAAGLFLPSAQALVIEGGGLLLERVLAAFRAIPDAAHPGTLLYDADATRAAAGVLADLVSAGHVLSQGVSLDLGFLTAAGSKAAVALEGDHVGAPAPVRAPHAGAAEGDVLALIAQPVELEVWAPEAAGGKARKAAVSLDKGRAHLTLTFGAKDGAPAVVPLRDVRRVVAGNPPSFKKKFFGRSARGDRSLALEGVAGALLLHVEFEDKGEKARDSVAAACAALVGTQVSAK